MLNYHDIDVLLPVQKFLVDFSFSGNKPLNFVHSILLRTLRLGPCSSAQLANFLNLDQNEITIILNELLAKKEIKSTENDLFELAEVAKRYFKSISDIPQVEQISDRTVSLIYDLIGFDPVLSYESSSNNGIQIQADQDRLSESEKIAKAAFQKNFYSYIDQGILTFYQNHPQLYKIGKVTNDRQLFNRVNLDLLLKLQGDQLTPDVHAIESCFSHLPSSTALLTEMVISILQSIKVDNIDSIQAELAYNPMLESLKIKNFLKKGKLDLTGLAHRTEHQIVGPIYMPNNQEKFLNLLERCAEDKNVQDLYWLTPSNPFFGESTNFKNLLNKLITSESYDLNMFLPCTSLKKALWENNHIERSLFSKGKFLALDESGLFNSDFEVLVVKNKFCIVIAHIHDSDASVLTAVPIGELTFDLNVVNGFADVFAKSKQQADEERGPCYGVITAK
ncbi:hypothetical protein [Acinetobacter sp. ABJ_C5_2]|uniref:hypothetical protein n=1 Tax=Acinetobacter sp. ABJ_C5_2 TaxID=3376992 RepID=UPI0037C880CC